MDVSLSIALIVVGSSLGFIQGIGLLYVRGIREEMHSIANRLEEAMDKANENAASIGVLQSQKTDLERRLEVLTGQLERQTGALERLHESIAKRWAHSG